MTMNVRNTFIDYHLFPQSSIIILNQTKIVKNYNFIKLKCNVKTWELKMYFKIHITTFKMIEKYLQLTSYFKA